ncbi:MAG: hypothetical protein V1859_08960 [archaeon]
MRKAQITLFIIIGIVMIAFFVLLFTTSEKVQQKKTEKGALKTTMSATDLAEIRNYIEECLKKVGEEALFGRIGPNGGYINVLEELEYQEYGTPNRIYYDGEYHPIVYDYKDGQKEFYNLSIDQIKNKTANYIAVEMQKCIDLSLFENVYNITGSAFDYTNVKVNINFEDVDVEFNYTITLRKKDSEATILSFISNIPVRLGLAYSNITMNLIKNLSNFEFYTPTEATPEDDTYYNMLQYCEQIVPGGCTGNTQTISRIIFEDIVSEGIPPDHAGIIIIEDNRTQQSGKSFNFTFALMNVNISGICKCGTSTFFSLNVFTSLFGTTTPEGSGFYTPGQQVILTASPEDGYVFDHWEGDVDDPNSATTNIIMGDDEDVKAYFKEDFITPPFTIKNSDADIVATFSDRGNIVLKGSCTAAPECIAPADSFVIKDSTVSTIAYVDASGNLCVEDDNCNDNDADCSNPGNGNFLIKDSNNLNVIYINEAGALCLIGSLTENGNP